MENYYFDLARLPEKFSIESALSILRKHNFNAFNVSQAPKNKHIGSGAWHDDVIAFLEANYKEEVVPVEVKAEVVDFTVKGEWTEAIHTDTPQPDESELKEITKWFDSKADEEHKEFVDELQGKKPKKKAAKKSEEPPNLPTPPVSAVESKTFTTTISLSSPD